MENGQINAYTSAFTIPVTQLFKHYMSNFVMFYRML